LIVADPDFDLRRGDAARLAQQIPGSVVSAQTRSVLSDGLKLGRVRRLPGTAAEAELIAPRIEKLSKRKPNVFLAAKAMEATVKAARRPQMLVISTHGFFLDEQDLRQQAAAEVRSVGGETSSASTLRKGGKLFEEPLLRCGLLLAACNDQPKPGETRPGDDGVLTGLEVMGLDLRGCSAPARRARGTCATAKAWPACGKHFSWRGPSRCFPRYGRCPTARPPSS
jgi:hypothetical protein